MATITAPIEVIGGLLTEDYPHGQPMKWETFQVDQTTGLVTPQKPSTTVTVWCRWPECQHQQGFARKQELERHTYSCHLPSSLCCPNSSCYWRGTRKDELKKHMKKGICGDVDKIDPEMYKIFDAKWIFDFIYDDPTDTSANFDPTVTSLYVLDFIRERAMELQKTTLWGDPSAWGRQPKGRLG